VAVAVTVLFLLGLLFPLLGVKEDRSIQQKEEKTNLKQMWRALVGNDQLMWVTLSMALFMVGYVTTTSFATYYMQYVFGDINMYAVLAAVVGVAQIAALLIFPLFSKKFNRKQLYTGATVLVVLGYLVFLFAENSLALIAVCALLLFVGQAFIQLLMLMFLADTIEYGQWKLGKRNESVTFSIQPLINKLGGALATALVSIGVVLSGIKTGDVAAETIDAAGKTVVKGAMFIIPLVFIVVGYIIYRKKYKLDEKRYGEIVAELEAKGELVKK
jgi:melibiose permease/lactose/raffinose/galactose permease